MQIIFSEQEIRAAVKGVAAQIKNQPGMEPDFLIPIMNGAFVFGGDLLRGLYPEMNPMIWPIKMFRAPSGVDPKRFIALVQTSWLGSAPPGGVENKRLLLVDTIFDTGETIAKARDFLSDKGPRSISVACLVWRNQKGAIGQPSYYGFDMQGSNEYLYGYGLDKDHRYRGSPDIYF